MNNKNCQTKKDKRNLFKCVHCCLEFSSQFQIKLHLNEAHLKMNETEEIQQEVEALKEDRAKVRRFSCHLCELEFALRENLKFHVENDH